MQAHEANISKLMTGDHSFEVPIFQRNYSWKKNNWGDFMNDLIHSITSTESLSHFMGAIVLSSSACAAKDTVYTIIDGQQRLWTITLFLVALR